MAGMWCWPPTHI